MLFFVSVIKLIAEIALLALAGQGILYLLAGAKREQNFFYQLLKVVAKPFTKAARWIAPRQVADHQVPFVAFFLLLIIWTVATFEKVRYCVNTDMVGCK